MANANPSPRTRFQKGQVANPRGASAHDPLKKALKIITLPEYRKIIEIALTGSVEDLRQMLKRPDMSALQVGVAKALLNAITLGDSKVIDRFVERIVGKIPDQVHVETSSTLPKIDLETYVRAMRELEAEV